MKTTVLVAAALAAAICATTVWSQGIRVADQPRHVGGMRMACPAMAVMPYRGRMIDSMAHGLKLTPDQVAKLKKAAASSDKTLQPLRQEAAKLSQALRAAVLAPNYSAKTVKDLAARAESAEAKIVAASIDEWTRIRSILTASQLAKLQKATSAGPWGPGRRPEGPPPAGKR